MPHDASYTAEINALIASAPREALEQLVRASLASGSLTRDQLNTAVNGASHGKLKVLGVIPSRFGSTRFPGKPLADLGGKPMIWVCLLVGILPIL